MTLSDSKGAESKFTKIQILEFQGKICENSAHKKSYGMDIISGLILGLHPANERWRYLVTTFLIGWVQA